MRQRRAAFNRRPKRSSYFAWVKQLRRTWRKMQLNSEYGKLGSRYSVIYAPADVSMVAMSAQLAMCHAIEHGRLQEILPEMFGRMDKIKRHITPEYVDTTGIADDITSRTISGIK